MTVIASQAFLTIANGSSIAFLIIDDQTAFESFPVKEDDYPRSEGKPRTKTVQLDNATLILQFFKKGE